MANVQQIRPAPGLGEVDLEIDDTQDVSDQGVGDQDVSGQDVSGQDVSGQAVRGTEEGHQARILVLSRNAALVDTVTKAAPRGAPVMHAPDLDQVAGRLSDLKPGVLVADTASTADIASMVAQLTQHFPELVVVVAGKREDSGALMQLTATGRIFRFLLTPLSHGQTRLALEAAVTHYTDLAAAGVRQSTAGAGGAGRQKNYVATYGALAAGLLLIVGGIWFGVNRFAGAPEGPSLAQPIASAQAPAGVPDRPDPVQAEIALADDAYAQGKFYEPSGESALDLYLSALALDPGNETARAGVRSVADKVLERAERALTAEQLEDAVFAIEKARNIDPAHPRLSFLDTQISRERERLQLTLAHEVGTRVRTLAAQANERMRSGRLLTPLGGSARDSLLEARRLDPTDPGVLLSIREFGGILTDEARNALAAGKPEEAQRFANAARQFGAAGAALAAVERSLVEATRSAAAGSAASVAAAGVDTAALVMDVRQRITAGKLIEPDGDSARDALAKLAAAAPGHPEVAELSRALSTRLVDSSRQALAARALDRSGQLLAAARQIGGRYDDNAISQAERDLAAARDADAQQASIVSAASLKRTRMVNPVYPEFAQKRGIEGWIELVFTVQSNGTVDGVEVRNASPAEVFDDAAIRAVRGWRFEPVVRNGEKVPQRAMVRLKFAHE